MCSKYVVVDELKNIDADVLKEMNECYSCSRVFTCFGEGLKESNKTSTTKEATNE